MNGYEKAGSSTDARRMREKTFALVPRGSGLDYVQELEKQADKLEQKARDASLNGEDDGSPQSSSEIWPKAASKREQASFWLESIATDEENSGHLAKAAKIFRAAAKESALAARDLEDAAEDEPETGREQQEAKKEYDEAQELRLNAASLHHLAGRLFDRNHDVHGKDREQKAEERNRKSAALDAALAH